MKVQVNIKDYEDALTSAYGKLADAEVKIYGLMRRVRELESSHLTGVPSTPSASRSERTEASRDEDSAALLDIINENNSPKPKEPDPQKKKEAG